MKYLFCEKHKISYQEPKGCLHCKVENLQEENQNLVEAMNDCIEFIKIGLSDGVTMTSTERAINFRIKHALEKLQYTPRPRRSRDGRNGK